LDTFQDEKIEDDGSVYFMADEYSDEEGEDEDKPYHFIDKDGYIVVSLEAINKIRETIGKPKVGENMIEN
jgi:hypothetical protein